MAAVELDPVFVKALKLLHSKAKDSGAQLKAMLDDAIAQRKGLKVPAQSGDAGKFSPGRSKSEDESKRKEAEKRPPEKSSKDYSEPEVKKAKLDSKSRSKEEKEAREKEKEKERARREKEKKEKEERDAQKQKEKAERERKEKELTLSKVETEIIVPSDEEEPASQMDAGDFALEMGIACVVCKQFGVSSGNQLVECQECHNLYHQECHKPPVTEEDVSDPRFVWYCSRCTKSLKKMVTQKPTAKPKPQVPTTGTSKESTALSTKTTKTDSNSSNTSQAFRRIDPKAIVAPKETPVPASSTSKHMVGLEGLAANLVKPRSESKSGNSSRKGDQKEGSKSSNKSENKSSSGYKSDSSSKSSSGKEEKKHNSSKTSSFNKDEKDKEKDKKSDGGAKFTKTDDRKENESSSKSSQKEEKKSESSSKHEKKPESSKAQSVGLSKLDVSSPKNSPPQAGSVTTPLTPESPSLSSSKASASASNKQAVANLSLVTANKRIQMMKKKAQTKPGGDKKVHVK